MKRYIEKSTYALFRIIDLVVNILLLFVFEKKTRSNWIMTENDSVC